MMYRMAGFLAFVAVLIVLSGCRQDEKNQLVMGTAANPLLKGDVPDPSVIRVDDAYYMVSTTMYFSPIAPIMKSYDLINWRIISYCTDIFDDLPVFRLETENSERIGDYNRGQWAASLRYFNDRFWVLFTNLTTNKSYLFSTYDPENEPWERWENSRRFYDASIFHDPTSDRTYIVHGRGPINLTEMSNDLKSVKPGQSDILLVSQGDVAGGVNAEGAHMFYVNGYYYIFLITWGTSEEHIRQALCYRSEHVDGPYEGRVVLKRGLGNRGGGVAQGGIVDTPEGDWYGFFFQDRDAVGRVPVLVPMRWEENWPVFAENGAIPETFQIKQSQSYKQNLYVSDEFNDTTLPLAWQWNHNPDNDNWSLTERPGFLRLRTGRTSKTVFHARNTLTQRTFEPACEGIVAMETTGMKDGDIAGLMALASYGGFVGIEQEHGQKYIAMYIADNESDNRRGQNAAVTLSGSRVEFTGDRVYFKINFRFRGATGDNTETAAFAYSLDGETWNNIGTTLEIRYTLTHFTGYRFGLFNYATQNSEGYVDFDYFHVSPNG
jgi:beta-xylosidase